jgi:hypothetical protein
MKTTIAKMLVEVLSILAIATEEIKQCRMSGSSYKLNTPKLTEPCLEKLLKKLVGKTYIKDALRRLDKLTQEEARVCTSQVLQAMILSMNEDTNKSVAKIAYGTQTSANPEKQSNTELPRWKGRRGSNARKSQ